MKAIDRICLIITALILLTVAVFGILVLTNVFYWDDIVDIMFDIDSTNWLFVVVVIVIAVILITLAIKIAFIRLRKKEKTKPGSLLKVTDIGAIFISEETLVNLTLKSVRDFEQIKDVKVRVICQEQSVSIQLVIMVMPDVKLPELITSLQQTVKEYVEVHSGINVLEIKVLVDHYKQPTKQTRKAKNI